MPEELEFIPEEIWEKNRQRKQDMKNRYHEVLPDTYDFCMENGLEHIFGRKSKPRVKSNKPSKIRRRG